MGKCYWLVCSRQSYGGDRRHGKKSLMGVSARYPAKKYTQYYSVALTTLLAVVGTAKDRPVPFHARKITDTI